MTPTPERLREIAEHMDDDYREVSQDDIDDLRAWANELEGSTQPALPTRREIADEIQPVICLAIRSYVDSRTYFGVSSEAAWAVAGQLLGAGWVRVSGET